MHSSFFHTFVLLKIFHLYILFLFLPFPKISTVPQKISKKRTFKANQTHCFKPLFTFSIFNFHFNLNFWICVLYVTCCLSFISSAKNNHTAKYDSYIQNKNICSIFHIIKNVCLYVKCKKYQPSLFYSLMTGSNQLIIFDFKLYVLCSIYISCTGIPFIEYCFTISFTLSPWFFILFNPIYIPEIPALKSA